MVALGYLLKLKRGLELAFGEYDLHDFSKNVPYLNFSQLTIFECHTFFLLKISNKMCHYFLI